MANVRTVDFLPEIFQTPTNRQFLSSTLDQLVQEPNFNKTQGFIGRKIGPGVNANDRYVIEPSVNRDNYQLEPGVVFRRTDTEQAQDAITYPGFIDTIGVAGGNTSRADRLFESEYYNWDPFVDYDKLVNYSEYYWLPGGPNAVTVTAAERPVQSNIQVIRNTDFYTFDVEQGSNPTLTLVRGGSYKFRVTQNRVQTFNYRVTNRGSTAYVIDFKNNPDLTLVRGNTYQFNLVLGGDFPFWIKTLPTTGRTNVFDRGVTNNGNSEGIVSFTVPYDAPDLLYYAAETSAQMQGRLNIVNPVPGTGPGFFIQVDPGVDGVVAATPNISGRDVLGVTNNGEDLGVVEFDVPLKTAQNFYYSLPQVENVDLVTFLRFDQINNVYVDEFLQQYGGIDGIVDLNNKTLVFPEQVPVRDQSDAVEYGWVDNEFYSPYPDNSAEYQGQPGSYGTPTYAGQTPIIPKAERYSVWEIQYRQDLFGRIYMALVRVRPLNVYDKFQVRYGTVYSSTQWFKNAEEYIERIPLLTAVLDTLYYQDGVDPTMFGQIRLIDQEDADTLFVADILGKKQYTSPNGVVFTNGLKIIFRDNVFPESYANVQYYVEGVGTAIELMPVTSFVTPETYTEGALIPFDSLPFDVGNYDADQNQPLRQDYITINRAAADLNAWTRSNRWFHRQVIEQTAVYTNQVAVLNQDLRAKRPILEFRAGIKLFDAGNASKLPVNVIDFNTTDAFSQINGTTAFNIDGYQLENGSRVIFANDTDPAVRDRIYQVEFISPDTVPPIEAQPIINLTLATDGVCTAGDMVVCLNGNRLQGVSFYFDGLAWQQAQQKNGVNQPPLFDIFDRQGRSLSDPVAFPGSTFAGSPLVSYAIDSDGVIDPTLGFPIRFLTINNVGDIVFNNNFYTDSFLYVVNRASQTEPISNGYVRQYRTKTDFQELIGWQTSRSRSRPYQQFRFEYDGTPLILDVRVVDQTADTDVPAPLPSLKLYAAGNFLPPSSYNYTRTDNTTIIQLNTVLDDGTIIEVSALSDQASQVAFYQIPVNLENNALNQNAPILTLGTIRNHYNSIGQNLIDLQGPINGSNNSRDLGNLVPYGGVILQQSSPLTLAGLFLRDPRYNIFDSIQFNSREYEKFKSVLMETVAGLDVENKTTDQILTEAMLFINEGRNEFSPFYWSDMLPVGSVFTATTYTVTPISTPVFDTVQAYDYTSSNYLGMNVYLNNRLLVRGIDYVVGQDSLSITVLAPLSTGDQILLQEFASTVGNFVPNTPTKLGLYPASMPEIYEDTTYATPQTMILGHDGSKTLAYGDIRDQVLLQFERRVYNNLKITSPIPIEPYDVIPGFFRERNYSSKEIQDILDQDFLAWVGANRLGYTDQDYVASNSFTWNYSQAGNRLTGTPLQGAWRGIYLYFYDTITPHLTPWEMLGFVTEPQWWQSRYGAAPYTSGNLLLWRDLEAGRIAEPGNDRINPLFARPGLTEIIPAGPQGELLSPFDSVVGAYDPTGFRGSWSTGDYGPTEYSWRVSSSYPFALMRLYALTNPAEFFSLFVDRDLYKFDDVEQQYLYNQRYRLDANQVQVYGQGTSKASYIDWIVDYSFYSGNATAPATISQQLKNIDVRLCYRMAGFSDKKYLKLFLEKPTPASSNTSLMLPDESYDLLLYKNQPSTAIQYSGVIVQRVDRGYRVFGFSEVAPYFSILVSKPLGLQQTITAGGSSVRVPTQYTDDVVQVPYGYTFTDKTVVADFLLSYGELLTRQGLLFDSSENGVVLNWNQMVQEFLYWDNQGWQINSIICLNPAANVIEIERPRQVVNDITQNSRIEQLLDQNKQPLDLETVLIEREGNRFRLITETEKTLSYGVFDFVSYEHMIVLRNRSVFQDLIYAPETGARQSRLTMIGTVTGDWNGQLDAQGFILNSDNIEEWSPRRRYTKGEIVRFKNNLYSALTIVQPSERFDFNQWVISDYEQIQKGLLPNLPNKADQLANSYDVADANLETDNDLLSYGLIGFRPRQYMAALDINDVSQVNVYQQFLGTKGSIRSVKLLSNANFGKEAADYQIYENWAILAGTYGAQANRRFVDLQLDAADLTANPSVVAIVEPDTTSLADQTVGVSDIYASSFVVNRADVFPTANIAAGEFNSAGYVNIEDVDITLFDLETPGALAPFVDDIGVGTTIWVAKTNAYDWQIYRCQIVPATIISVSDNLDGTSIVNFNAQHGLRAGQIFIIKEFAPEVDGVYRVVTVPSLYSVSIVFQFDTDLQITSEGDGRAFTLNSIRVPQASDVVNLPYANDIRSGARVWVDNVGDGKWAVLEKREPVTFVSRVQPPRLTNQELEPNTRFGQAVAQRADNLLALIGRPDYENDRGVVLNYAQVTRQVNTAGYQASRQLSLQGAAGVRNYGYSIAVGNNNWAIAGAPNSAANDSRIRTGYAAVLRFDENLQAFEERQLLLALNQPRFSEFGYSVAMSADERWLYVGAPGVNAVYAYARQPVQSQSQTFTVRQVTNQVTVSEVTFTNDKQLQVTRNGVMVYQGFDYTVIGNTIVFFVLLQPGTTVVVTRATEAVLDTELWPNLSTTIYTGSGEGARFNISLVRGAYTASIVTGGEQYAPGDTLTFPGTLFGGQTPLNDCVIEVDTVQVGAITSITVSGSFIPMSGLPSRFDIDEVLYSASNISSVTVFVNGVLQRPKYDYEVLRYDDSTTPDSTAGDQIFLDFVSPPPFGAEIRVRASSYWDYVDMITVPGIDSMARFGASVSTTSDGRQVIVGAPGATAQALTEAGTVYVFDRHVERFLVTDPSVTVYQPNAALIAPTSVSVNSAFLNNSLYFNGTGFSDDGTAVTITAPLAVGDQIVIDTNQFELLQTITASAPQTKAAFGSAVDMCRYNCSLYTGAPNYSLPGVAQAGAVEREVNVARIFGMIRSTVQNASLQVGDTVRVNDYEIAVPNVTGAERISALALAITAVVPNVVATVDNGYLIVSVLDMVASVPGNRLTVLPGAIGSAYFDLGFEAFEFTQTILSPVARSSANFGASLNIDSTATVLSVAAPNGDTIDPITFDQHTTPITPTSYVLDPLSATRPVTTFDSRSTTFFDLTPQSGVVYTFDFLGSVPAMATNPGKFVFGQQLRNDLLQSQDQFGTSLSYVNNVFLIGSPGVDLQDSSANEGGFFVYNNPNNQPAWQVYRSQPQAVNVNLFNSVSMYDRLVSTTNQFFDFFDPLQGKLLGAVASNLDYISSVDPAVYNSETNPGNTWAQYQLGQTWWDTANVRFIDPSAGDIKYAAIRWGTVFPGSSVDIYQWTESSVPPSAYTGPGEPRNLVDFVSWSQVNDNGIIQPVYFFWVKNITTVAKQANKTLSVEVIARYVEDPRSSGIAYVAPVAPNALAIYNGLPFIKASDTILHVEFDQQPNQAAVHQEFQLITEEQPGSFLNDRLYLKMQDSLAGISASGAAVPDPNLSPAMRFGPEFTPRQSLVVDRFLALQNYIDYTNRVLSQVPIAENRRIVILNSADPEPSAASGMWDDRVANLEQLSWQNINIVPLGYRYLVESDADNAGLWTIYTVVLSNNGLLRELRLTQVQSWDVKKYWDYVDWYQPGFNPSSQVQAEVNAFSDLETLDLPVGSVVKVRFNSQNKFELYLRNATGWQRVALEDGTIAISTEIYDYALGKFGFDGEVFDAQYFDQTPQIETRKIIESINQELFVDDLEIERNRALVLLFNYIIGEQQAVPWLIKTSLIDVTHRIRDLLPYQTYRRDNQDFVLDYINEVKPYHVQVRQFNLQYSGDDDFQGDITDYDVPAFFDQTLIPAQFVSPILQNSTDIQPGPSVFAPNAGVWLDWPYSQWFNNYLLSLESIDIVDTGTGYTFPPVITLLGQSIRPAELQAVINSAGQLIAINILDPGEGYLTTPQVVIKSTLGQGARAIARMGNDLVRSFRTVIKYDRYQYRPNYEPWLPNETYDNGTLVIYDDRVWEANSADSSGVNTAEFDPSDWILVPVSQLSGVDRTMAYYVATANEPGRVLSLLIEGVDYPGVQVTGVAFDAATGFSSDPYDTYVFDNIETGPEGLPTYSNRILNAIYTSEFLDQYLGTRITDVNVEGGAFIDTYSSHAPEELVPGSEFDTLDFRVYTTPGADWEFNGHGSQIGNRRFEFDPDVTVLSWAGLVDFPVAVQVTNATAERELLLDINYTVDWVAQTITVLGNVAQGDVIMIRVYELGGGNQLYRTQYIGSDIVDRVVLPVQTSLIQEIAVFVNGEVTNSFTYSALANETLLEFSIVLTASDFVSITVLGVSPGDVVRSWSKPMTQYILVTDPAQTTYTLTNSLSGTNPVNMIVLRNGRRVRPYQTISYIADGSSVEFLMPQRGGYSQGLISDPDVSVYVDNVLQTQFNQYNVDPWDGSSLRTITFVTAPPVGSEILVALSTRSSYTVSAVNSEITFRFSSSFGLVAGDVLSFITWNDVSQQRLETEVFVGPVVVGTTVVQPYDSTLFDEGDILNEPGTFDYSAPGTTTVNDLDLRRPFLDPGRLWVNLNGARLVSGLDFTLQYTNTTTYLILPSLLSTNDVVSVTVCTDSVVPEAMAFRIFQDMRGVQATFRITPETTTQLSQPLLDVDDVVYVQNAAALGEPNVANNVWGVITVGAERIMYRERDLVNNSVSGLLRGTAGTAIANHPVDTLVYDMGGGNLLPAQYQDYVVLATTISDGTTNVFVAPDLDLNTDDLSTLAAPQLRVTLGGITVPPTDYTILQANPATIEFGTTPPRGIEVTLFELRGVSWYQPGINTASDGRPLQLTNTEAAKFLRGQ